jgi:peptidoglycan hydrolase-like protein with peptidoglycan-binding domain
MTRFYITFLNTILTAVLVVLISAVTVAAQDVALLIGNRNYQRASTMFDAEKIVGVMSKLQNSGYFVVAGQDLSIDQTRGAMNGFAVRLGQADRAIIVLNGHFVYSDSDTWFVPVNAFPPNPISINFEGLSLRTILDYAAQRPGGAAVFLGTSARPIAVTDGLKAGIGDLDIPQGVLVVTGSPADIAKTLERDFLKRGASVTDALENAPDTVFAMGYVSDFASLAKKPRPVVPPDDGSNDDGYWQATRELDSEAAMRAYLRAFPRGKHAPEAQKFLDELVVLTPLDIAKAAEAALGLGRSDRREIQENLTDLGYDTRGIDGIFGRVSRRAIGDWQEDRGFNRNGYLTQRQISRLAQQASRSAEELAEAARKKQLALEKADQAYWQSSGAASGKAKGYRRYLGKYPDGLYSDVAAAKLQQIEDAKKANAGFQEQQNWNSAKTINSIDSYQDYLDQYGNGVFSAEAETRIAKLKEEATNAAAIATAEKEEADLRLNGFGRLLVEQQLNALSFDTGSVDGVFDKRSRRAIRRFQKARGFPVTGFLNRRTIVQLIAESGG